MQVETKTFHKFISILYTVLVLKTSLLQAVILLFNELIWGTTDEDVRGGLADVLDALQRVDGVGAPKDAGSEHNGEGVG